jgi:hypothetical protein
MRAFLLAGLGLSLVLAATVAFSADKADSSAKLACPVSGQPVDKCKAKVAAAKPDKQIQMVFGDPATKKKLPSITLLAKGKRAASYRIKFGDEALQKELSAVTHVAKGKNIPPFLVLRVADQPETKAQSQRLVKALVEAGIPATAYPAAGKNHTTINADLGLPNDRPTQEVFAFLGAVLNRH